MTAPRYHIDGETVQWLSKRQRPRWLRRARLVLAGLTVALVGFLALNPRVSEAGDDSYQLEPDRPYVVDLGDGWSVRTACGAVGQRVYITTPAKSSASLGVSLSVPGGVSVVNDKECR